MKRLGGCHRILHDAEKIKTWTHGVQSHALIHDNKIKNEVVDFSHFTGDLSAGDQSVSALFSVNGESLSKDGICVHIIGEPYWHDNEFVQMQNTDGNAAVVLKLYQAVGQACLEKISGPFALAIIDNISKKQIYAIDRIGIFGLYYHIGESNEAVVSTELQTLAKFPHISLEIDPQGIFNYLYFHMVPSPGTIYRGIKKLEPGQCLVVSSAISYTELYWNPEFKVDKQSGFTQLAKRLKSLLHAAVARSGINEQSGAFLSGGLDSTTVVGVYAELSKHPRSFSIGFDAKGFDEIEYARISASHYHARLTEYYVTPADVADAVQKIAAYYEEPFGNASAIPTYYCAKLARENGVSRLLAGDGGDELFAGNARYAQQKVFEWYFLIPWILRRGLIEPIAKFFPAGEKIMPVRKLRSYIKQANIRLPYRLHSYNFLDREGVDAIFHPDFLASIDTQQPAKLFNDTYQRSRASDKLNKMLYLDWKFTLADNDLRKVNHMCHLAGIEVCYPMLDDAMVDFSCEVPPSLKLKGLKLRYFYKNALADFLPPQTLTKSKHGFGLPFGVWLKNDPALQALANENLANMKSRGIFSETFIDTLIEQHREGHANYYGDMIWAVMMLELWLSAHQS